MLALVVALGAIVFAFELAARAQARLLVSVLSPLATLSYAGAGAGWGGSVRLDAPRIEFHHGPWLGVLQAREARLTGPGVFWLIAGRLFGGTGIPDEGAVDLFGLTTSTTPDASLVSEWLQPFGLILFESLGCNSNALTSVNRQDMGVFAGERHDRLVFRHDATAHRLELTLDAETPALAAVHGYVDLTGFKPALSNDPRALSEIRLAHGEMGYRDPGYLARRNAFCAQGLDMSVAQFIDRHIAAVDTLLADHGIIASEDVRRLYRQLVSSGGALNFTSLPEPTWVPAQIDTYLRNDLLRQLNITIRHDDAPPVMLRLSFNEPTAPAVVTEVLAAGAPPLEALAVTPAEAITPPLNATLAAAVPTLVTTAEAAAQPPISVSPAVPLATSRAPLAATPPTEPVAPPTERPVLSPAMDPRMPGRELGASAPPPPKDSTLALVWRPGVIERLETREVEARDYEIVAANSLAQYTGRRLRLLTQGGKLVDGRLIAVEPGRALLSVRVGGGNAEIGVAISNIREARLVRASSE